MARPNIMAQMKKLNTGGGASGMELLQEKRSNDLLSSYEISYINPELLVPSPFNSTLYDDAGMNAEGLEHLIESIKMDGLQQALLVAETVVDGKTAYEIISGHRRYSAIMTAYKNNDEVMKKRFIRGVPCKVLPKDYPEYRKRILLIDGNATSRIRDAQTMRKELLALKEAYEQAEEHGDQIPVSLKEIVSRDYNLSERQYSRYSNSFHLIPDLEDAFNKKEFDIKMAGSIGAKPVDIQEVIFDRYKSIGDITKTMEEVSSAKLMFDNALEMYDTNAKKADKEYTAVKKERASLRNVGSSDERAEANARVRIAREERARAKELRQQFLSSRKRYIMDVLENGTPKSSGYTDEEIGEDVPLMRAPEECVATFGDGRSFKEALSTVESDLHELFQAVNTGVIDDTSYQKLTEMREYFDRVISIYKQKNNIGEIE